MPDALYEKLKAAADQNGRSLNAEIVARLEASFGDADVQKISRLLDAQTELIIAEIRRADGDAGG